MIAQIVVYVVSIIVLSFVQTKLFLKNRQLKEAALYVGLMTVCAVLGSLFLAGIDIPSLVVPYEIVFQPIGKMILK